MMDELEGRIRDALRVVIDPELGHNIVDLGFIYGIAVTNGDAWIVMTATTRGCPAAGFLREGAANAAMQVSGVRSVDVTMTFGSAVDAVHDRACRPSLARLCRGQLTARATVGACA